MTARSSKALKQAPAGRRRIAVDLFSGCGGLTTGLARAGFRVRLAVDNDPLALEAYRLNHRRTRLWCRDLFEVDGAEILDVLQIDRGELDLLAGCPPCQGFSGLRTLNGARVVEDDRNNLVAEFARLVTQLRPRAVLMENVPGLALDSRLQRLLARLRRHGYKVRWDILDAADFGVPQRRRRLILFAARIGAIALPEEQPIRRTVREAISGLPTAGESGDTAHDHLENRSERVRVLISQIPKDGGSRGELGPSAQLACHKRTKGFHDIYGRMAWDAVSPTITSGFVNPSKGRFLHPSEDRTVTVREAALLQSFPATYRFPMWRGKYPVSKMLGNAVPPVFAEVQGRSIAEFLDAAGEAHA